MRFVLPLLLAALSAACATPRGPCGEQQPCPNSKSQPSAPGVLLRAAWGSELGSFGEDTAEEGNSAGPMSLAYDAAKNELLILDQLNARIQRLNASGQVLGELKIPEGPAQDLAVLPVGQRIAVLYRFVRESLVVLDGAGKIVEEVKLVGAGIPHPSSVLGLYVTEEGLWAKAEGVSVLLLGPEGAALSHRVLEQGTVQGKSLYKVAHAGTEVGIFAEPRHTATGLRKAALRYDTPVSAVTGFQVDGAGHVFVVTLHREEGEEGIRSRTLLKVLSPELKLLRTEELPKPHGSREIFRSTEPGPDGQLYYLRLTSDGIELSRY
jgi:hypothetical protein